MNYIFQFIQRAFMLIDRIPSLALKVGLVLFVTVSLLVLCGTVILPGVIKIIYPFIRTLIEYIFKIIVILQSFITTKRREKHEPIDDRLGDFLASCIKIMYNIEDKLSKYIKILMGVSKKAPKIVLVLCIIAGVIAQYTPQHNNLVLNTYGSIRNSILSNNLEFTNTAYASDAHQRKFTKYVMIKSKVVNIRNDTNFNDNAIYGTAYKGELLKYLGQVKTREGQLWYNVEFDDKNKFVIDKVVSIVYLPEDFKGISEVENLGVMVIKSQDGKYYGQYLNVDEMNIENNDEILIKGSMLK